MAQGRHMPVWAKRCLIGASVLTAAALVVLVLGCLGWWDPGTTVGIVGIIVSVVLWVAVLPLRKHGDGVPDSQGAHGSVRAHVDIDFHFKVGFDFGRRQGDHDSS